MKYLILTILFIISTNSFSQELTKDEIENLSFNRLQSLRSAYINFVIDTEKEIPETKPENIDNNKSPGNALIYEIKLCFFGGWPSVVRKGRCTKPWEQKSINMVKAFGSRYTKDYLCGKKDFFRCNPTLFGIPDETILSPTEGITIDLNPKNGKERGYCIKRGDSFKNLTRKCAMVSKEYITKIIDTYQSDGTNLSKYSKAIGEYCKQHSKYHDLCQKLRDRVKEVTGKNLQNH